MKTILAAEAAQSTCPRWCVADVATDGPVIHLSETRSITVDYAGEKSEAFVSLEQRGDDQPGVRVHGLGDTPMSAKTAIEVGQIVTVLAFAAVSPSVVTQ